MHLLACTSSSEEVVQYDQFWHHCKLQTDKYVYSNVSTLQTPLRVMLCALRAFSDRWGVLEVDLLFICKTAKSGQ